MPKTLKRNAVIVTGLAALFYWSFMFAKHDPSLRGIIPFGEDPFDAVGSFGVLAGGLIVLVSLVRAFRPYSKPPSGAQRAYLLRGQMAVALAVCLAIAADAVAMARHPSRWIHAASHNELLGLLGSLGALSFAVQLLLCASRETIPRFTKGAAGAAAAPTLLAMLILALYPEQLIDNTAAHLLTVVAGALVLFAPMRPLLTALVPLVPYDDACETETRIVPERNGLMRAGYRWGFVLLVGVLVGFCIFVAEITEGGGTQPVARLVFLASVFIGLASGGLLIAYGFLGKPLGLTARR